jgi:thiamine-monophosphate kinase
MTAISQLGEQGLLQLVQAYALPGVVGDDAALLPMPPGESLVVTTDVLVDGTHFSDRTTSGYDAGWRAVAANLSDLAAMGASPLGVTIGLALPLDTPIEWVEDLYQGMAACLGRYHTPLVGGDLCRAPVKTLAITAFGSVQPQGAIARSTAQPGDWIVVSGPHGGSRAGLELLLAGPQAAALPPDPQVQTQLRSAHQRPQPRLDLLPHLQSLQPAGMDSSDGLADAVLQICRASGVGARLHTLPMHPGLASLPEAIAQDWTLYGGEDFELVLCLAPQQAARLLAVQGCQWIGEITPGSEVIWQRPDGECCRLLMEQGFQHFKGDFADRQD